MVQGQWVTRVASDGVPYSVWEKPVPRITDDFLDTVIYLYPSEAEALAGRSNDPKHGGSGFIASVPTERLPFSDGGWLYFVTNRHVIESGATVVRLNRRDGSSAALDLTERDWTIDPYGNDLAVCDARIDSQTYKIRSIGLKNFLTKELIEQHEIGPGDETFVIGRFVNAEGVQKNLPTARFGNIAQMPYEPIRDRRGMSHFDQESFIVEARSIGGFSGAPVLTFIPPLALRPNKRELEGRFYGPWLLGVDWCHINDWVKALDKFGREMEFEIISNSGMMGVIPAWKLSELLMIDELKERRRASEDRWLKENPSVVTRDVASAPLSNDANPNHRADFMRLVDAAARKPARED